MKAQVRLRIRAVWSAPSLSAIRLIECYGMYEWRAKARVILAHAHKLSESAQFAHARRGPYGVRASFFRYALLVDLYQVYWDYINMQLYFKTKAPRSRLLFSNCYDIHTGLFPFVTLYKWYFHFPNHQRQQRRLVIYRVFWFSKWQGSLMCLTPR